MTFTILIPRSRNDGSPVAPEEMEQIIESIWKRFGGLTSFANAVGHWLDEGGQHYEDKSIKATVACERDRLEEAKEITREIGRRLGQKAMYFEVRYYDGVQILKTE